ncbi:MAG: DUF559 domain-containing protein [Bacillota bacterium]|nr:DUF559 domain-containing protein [Bacillota bacterium]
MIEYFVFFGFVGVGLVVFIIHLHKPKLNPFVADPERAKLESPIERILYDRLKANGEYLKTQVPCGKYRIDIALPAYHIAIECDGGAFHDSKEQMIHDSQKNSYLKRNGWKVLRFPGKRIYRDMRGIIAIIDKEKSTG